jgi:hypothetical protein
VLSVVPEEILSTGKIGKHDLNGQNMEKMLTFKNQ